MVFDGRTVDSRYRLSNAKLIELLDISRDEERKLKTIVGETESKVRHAARERRRRATKREAAGSRSRSEYLAAAEAKRRAARGLRDKGWTIQEIATELGISVGSAYGYCKDGCGEGKS